MYFFAIPAKDGMQYFQLLAESQLSEIMKNLNIYSTYLKFFRVLGLEMCRSIVDT